MHLFFLLKRSSVLDKQSVLRLSLKKNARNAQYFVYHKLIFVLINMPIYLNHVTVFFDIRRFTAIVFCNYFWQLFQDTKRDQPIAEITVT